MLIRGSTGVYVPFDQYYMQFVASSEGKVANTGGFALVAFRQAEEVSISAFGPVSTAKYLVCSVDLSRLAKVSKSFSHLCAKNMDRTQVVAALNLLTDAGTEEVYDLPVDPLRFAVYLGIVLSDTQYVRNPKAKSLDRRVTLDMEDVAQATKKILIPQAEVTTLQDAHLGMWLGVFPAVVSLTGATTVFDAISAKVPGVSADTVYKVFQACRDTLAEVTSQAYGLGITAFSLNFPGFFRYEVGAQLNAKQQYVPIHKFTIDSALSAQARFLFSTTASGRN